MKKVISSGAIIFIKDKEIKYLLLQYGLGHWDFPRGLIEENENEKDAAIREIKEETGIADLKFISGFKEKIHFFYKNEGELISKEVVYLLAETKNKEIKLSYEHFNYEWLDYKETLKKFTVKTSKNVLKKANDMLNNSLINY